MTTIHFFLDTPLPSNAPVTFARNRDPFLRLERQALGGGLPEDHRLGYALMSLGLHAVLLAAILLAPLLGELTAPDPVLGVRAFFAEPGIMAPPPPPPPPAAPQAAFRKAPVVIPVAPTFVVPTEIPDRIAPSSMSMGGGVAGGVEGGVEGGVSGGIVGGLLTEIAPPPKPPTQVVRVGGDIREPKRLLYIAPEYPLIASQAGVAGLVILEARVATDGRVMEATVLKSQPLFDEAARAAVMQWRYQPLLLNGVAMDFILTVTVRFSLRSPE